MLVDVLFVLLGLGVLSWGADAFVVGAARLAVRFHLSPVVIGAVVVGFGTGAPELLVSCSAAADGSLDIGAGNVVGSNLANLTLVLGIAGLIARPETVPRVVRREAPLSLATVALFALLLQNGLTRGEGIVLLAALVAAVLVMLRSTERAVQREPLDVEEAAVEAFVEELEEFVEEPGEDELSDVAAAAGSRDVLRTAAGLVATLAGAQLLVGGATGIASEFGLSGGFVGLTLVAIGTSMPELVTAIQSARRVGGGDRSRPSQRSGPHRGRGDVDGVHRRSGLARLFLGLGGSLRRWEGAPAPRRVRGYPAAHDLSSRRFLTAASVGGPRRTGPEGRATPGRRTWRTIPGVGGSLFRTSPGWRRLLRSGQEVREMTTGIVAHYVPDGLIERVLGALGQAGHDPDRLDPAALATLEDFHLGGRATTARLADLAGIRPGARVIDLGCGIGGPARFLAQRGCHVTGVDLTPDFVALARELSARCGLADRVDIREADATALPFADAAFDVAWTQHVVMNIADKAAFYREARRVLRPGGRLALFDVVAGDGRPIHLPVPWASTADQSFLVPASEVAALVEGAGFAVAFWEDPTDDLRPAVAAVARAAAGDGPLLTPALYVPDAATRFACTLRNLEEGRTRLLYGVAEAA